MALAAIVVGRVSGGLGPSLMAEERTVARSGKATPAPAKRTRPIPPLGQGRRALVPFETAPFPYTGLVPATGKPFLDVQTEDRSGHLSPRTGQVFWSDETYSDSRVLLELPAGFNVNRPGFLVLFLHGNGATLERDVVKRQQVPQQVAGAGRNSALVAPQFARDAADSSAGRFWQPGALRAFLEEAAVNLARLIGDARAKPLLDAMPVVLVAYSGGYLPLAYLLQQGGAGERILGVIVLDGLYGEQPWFADWIAARRDRTFFAGSYGPSSAEGAAELAHLLDQRAIAVSSKLGPSLAAGNVTLLQVPEPVVHADFVTKAWTELPLRDLIRRVPGFARPSRP